MYSHLGRILSVGVAQGEPLLLGTRCLASPHPFSKLHPRGIGMPVITFICMYYGGLPQGHMRA